MSRVRMTKAALAGRRRDFATYAKALPSLELKRQQLMLDLAAEKDRAARLDEAAQALRLRVRAIPFAADPDVRLQDRLRIVSVERTSEPHLGILLPRIAAIAWAPAEGLATLPPWVAAALAVTRELAETKLHQAVAQQRVALVEKALRKAVQRINLLQQVYMPEARADIARIANFLADGERMAVARTKLLVSRRAARSTVTGAA